MTSVVDNVRLQVTRVIKEALKTAALKGELPECEADVILEKPREKAHGDMATNIAMLLTKALKKPPRIIAEILISNMQTKDTYIERVEIAGPGFINFYLRKAWLYEAIKLIEERKDSYGKIEVGQAKKVMVEFVSANPTGPMHMGNARGGALGDSLASVLKWAGYDVTREFYLNDAGAQIEKLGKSLEARYIQLIKGEDACQFPEDGYHGKDIITHMQSFIKEHGDKYLYTQDNKEVFIRYALDKNITKLKTDLEAYGIKYDTWFHETTLYEGSEVTDTIEMLKNSGYTYEKDDALWFKATEFGAEKDDVLIRNNGIPTYFAVDIAYHRNKFQVRSFDKVINIWGADHHGHVARMKGAMQAIGVSPDRLDIIIMQLVRLMQDGETVRMSKRTGEMITLSDLIEDTGVDAARFFFNLRQADSHFDFDLNLAKQQSNENPVFYVQYAHARICSILKLLNDENIAVKPSDDIDLSLLCADEEIELIIKLAEFPEEIRLAANAYDPTRLTRYAMDLAANFHSFYNACRVKSDDLQLMHARIMLIDCVRIVIKNALSILGVTAPERM